jgi:hypothetical protein
VTGALNGAPYLIGDRVLDSVERQIDLRRRAFLRRSRSLGHAASGVSSLAKPAS